MTHCVFKKIHDGYQECIHCGYQIQSDMRVVVECMKPPEIKGPSGAMLVKNLTKAVIKHVGSGAKKITQEQYDERLSICSDCDFHHNNRCLHASCGCFLKKKAWWASEDCPFEDGEFPDGKWPKLEE